MNRLTRPPFSMTVLAISSLIGSDFAFCEGQLTTHRTEIVVEAAVEAAIDAPSPKTAKAQEKSSQVEAVKPTLPISISGILRMRGVFDHRAEACIYIPLKDPGFFDRPTVGRRFEKISGRVGDARPIGGSTDLTWRNKDRLNIEEISPYIMKIKPTASPSTGEVTVSFRTELPRVSDATADEIFFAAFAPRIMNRCPEAKKSKLSFGNLFNLNDSSMLTFEAVDWQVSLEIPGGWQYLGIGGIGGIGASGAVQPQNQIVHFELTAPTFAFGLGHGFKRDFFHAAGVDVSIHYRNDDFRDLKQSVIAALERQTTLFGKFPFQSLAVVEGRDFLASELPGLVVINEPRQKIFKSLQTGWLNWREWTLVSLIATQWFGVAVAAESPDDLWLVEGLADFAVVETLSRSPLAYNLISPLAPLAKVISLNYLQVQELVAATLRRQEGDAILALSAKDDFRSAKPIRSQHPFLYVRHALAMRQLSALIGKEKFYSFLHQLSDQYRFGHISPRQFMASLKETDFENKAQLSKNLLQWWTKAGWPDFELGPVSSDIEDHSWHHQIEVRQKGALILPTWIKVVDRGGRETKVLLTPDDYERTSIVECATSEPIDKIEVDADHDVFDEDRFNNKNSFPSVKFFPGNATTFDDDNYLLGWLPFAYRYPGEPLSLGVQAALLHYLSSALQSRLSIFPEDGRLSGLVRYRLEMPSNGAQVQLYFEQTYLQDRTAEVAINRSFSLFNAFETSSGMKARYRENILNSESRHPTGAVDGKLRLSNSPNVKSVISGEIEYAPKELSPGFGYWRRSAAIDCDLDLSVLPHIGDITWSLRLFAGSLTTIKGTAPESSLFRANDIKEARVRVDLREIEGVHQIVALSQEVLGPMVIPLPGDSLVLNRHMKWRLFYDMARGERVAPIIPTSYPVPSASDSSATDNALRAAGMGFVVPFGGDMVGGGAIAFSKLNVLAILYSSAFGKVSRVPSVVFDLTGEL